MYPQIIQGVYAAKTVADLRRSVALLTRSNADEQRWVRERFFVFFERAPVGRT